MAKCKTLDIKFWLIWKKKFWNIKKKQNTREMKEN